MAQLLLITWWGNTIFPISFVEDHCSAVAEAVGMCTFVYRPGPGSNTRLQVAFDIALQRQGSDFESYAAGARVPESDLREAGVHAAEMVRSVERLLPEHGACDGNYEMYDSKGQEVVIFQGGRHRKCNVRHEWNSNKQRWCGGCRKRTYCGRHCQKADWPAHKPDCICRGPRVADSTAAATTTRQDFLAILQRYCPEQSVLRTRPFDSR